MKEKEQIHLSISTHNSLAACRKYIYHEPLTSDIRKVTCEECKKRISLIWSIDITKNQIIKVLTNLNELLKEL